MIISLNIQQRKKLLPMIPDIGDDVFVCVVCSFLLIRDVGILASVSQRCNAYLDKSSDQEPGGVWFVLMNSYFRNNSLYSFFVNASISSGPTRSDFALCTLKLFLSSHYSLGSGPATARRLAHQLPRMRISSWSWTSDEELSNAISKACKINTKFFQINNFELGIVEGIILSALLRRHNVGGIDGEGPVDHYNVLCDLYEKRCLDILDYRDIYALHRISIYASELYSRLLILFHSVLRITPSIPSEGPSRSCITQLLHSKDINCYRVFLDSL